VRLVRLVRKFLHQKSCPGGCRDLSAGQAGELIRTVSERWFAKMIVIPAAQPGDDKGDGGSSIESSCYAALRSG
jgi:hypothetical protein